MSEFVQPRILTFLAKGTASPAEIAQSLSLSKVVVAGALYCLRHKNLVQHIDRKPNRVRHRGHWGLTPSNTYGPPVQPATHTPRLNKHPELAPILVDKAV